MSSEENRYFGRGRTEIIHGLNNLRMYYRKHGLQNWHAAYGCP
jgi:hypothetical protein